VDYSQFISNQASVSGGAISIISGNIEFQNNGTEFLRNSAAQDGGALYIAKSPFLKYKEEDQTGPIPGTIDYTVINSTTYIYFYLNFYWYGPYIVPPLNYWQLITDLTGLLYVESKTDTSFDYAVNLTKGVSWVPEYCSSYYSGFWIGVPYNVTPAWSFSKNYACETDAIFKNAGFYSNTAARGGAIFLDQQTHLETDQLTITLNTASQGSGIYCSYGNWNYMNTTYLWANDPGDNIYCGANCFGPPCGCSCSWCEYCNLETKTTILPNNITENTTVPFCHRDFCTTPPECFSNVNKISQINNGNCDPLYNTLATCWDGGDCCNSTCNNYTILYSNIARQTCGSNGYNCLNPLAIEVIQNHPCRSIPLPNQVRNGWCDPSNNIAPCWDGGDCCNATCVGTCVSFDCLDPKNQPPEPQPGLPPGQQPGQQQPGQLPGQQPGQQPDKIIGQSSLDSLGVPVWGIVLAAVAGFIALIVIIGVVVYFNVINNSKEIV
jgi:hypothetical protein